MIYMYHYDPKYNDRLYIKSEYKRSLYVSVQSGMILSPDSCSKLSLACFLRPHLQTGVKLEEEELVGVRVEQVLHRPRSPVADVLGQSLRRTLHLLEHLRRHDGWGPLPPHGSHKIKKIKNKSERKKSRREQIVPKKSGRGDSGADKRGERCREEQLARSGVRAILATGGGYPLFCPPKSFYPTRKGCVVNGQIMKASNE